MGLTNNLKQSRQHLTSQGTLFRIMQMLQNGTKKNYVTTLCTIFALVDVIGVAGFDCRIFPFHPSCRGHVGKRSSTAELNKTFTGGGYADPELADKSSMSYQSTSKAHWDGPQRRQDNDFKVRLSKQDLFQLLKSEQTKEFCFWLKSYVRNIPHTFVKCGEERKVLLKDQLMADGGDKTEAEGGGGDSEDCLRILYEIICRRFVFAPRC